MKSAVDTTELVVVQAPEDEIDVRCGGAPMLAAGTEADGSATLNPAFSEGSLLGKRYADADAGIELLCTKAGEGSLSLGETPILVKDAKALPSSD